MVKEIMGHEILLSVDKAGVISLKQHSYEVESTDEPGVIVGVPKTHNDRGETAHKAAAEAAEAVFKANPASNALVNSLGAAAKTREGI